VLQETRQPVNWVLADFRATPDRTGPELDAQSDVRFRASD